MTKLEERQAEQINALLKTIVQLINGEITIEEVELKVGDNSSRDRAEP